MRSKNYEENLSQNGMFANEESEVQKYKLELALISALKATVTDTEL